MKKTSLVTFLVILSVLSLLVSCNKKSGNVATTTETPVTKIIVGATPQPHAEMLALVQDDMKEAGYTLEIKEFTDYVTPNEALESGEITANFYQHLPYMDSFNRDRGFHLVSAGGIHIEPLALYSKYFDSLDAFKNSRSRKSIAIPNDPTNEGRALLLLQSAGIITLNDSTSLESTPADIKDGAGIHFEEIEAASLPRVLDDVDAAVINGNYAIPAGLLATRDGLYIEGADSPYVNVIAVKQGNENLPAIKKLVELLKGEKVKKWVEETYPNGEVILV